jgi:hypothetical protein
MQRHLMLLCSVLVATVVASEPSARATPRPIPAKQIAYVDVHPIPTDAGGGFCNIEGPHVHVYRPEHADELYRVVGGSYLFIGDPVPFGYDGPKHAYYGRHPIPVDELVAKPHTEHDGGVYCYLDGPHYHIYVPPPTLTFVDRGNAYWYVGAWPRSYQLDAPRYQKINIIYAPLLYARPVVTASAPAGYHVPIIEVTVRPPAPAVRHPMPPVYPPYLVIEYGDRDYHRHHHHKHHHHKHGHDHDRYDDDDYD